MPDSAASPGARALWQAAVPGVFVLLWSLGCLSVVRHPWLACGLFLAAGLTVGSAATVLPAAPHRLEMPTASDGVVPFERIGVVELAGIGRLDVWWLDSYGGGVFLPLRDGTAGSTTYGAGRYLLDTVKGVDLGGDDGRLVVDLNFAYHPSCTYDPRWSCPLAPEGNRVSTRVAAGEQLPPGGWYPG